MNLTNIIKYALPLAGIALASGCATQKHTAKDLLGHYDRSAVRYYTTNATTISPEMAVSVAPQRPVPSTANAGLYMNAGLGNLDWSGKVFFVTTNGADSMPLDLATPWNLYVGSQTNTTMEGLDRLHHALAPYVTNAVRELVIGKAGQGNRFFSRSERFSATSDSLSLSGLRFYDPSTTNTGALIASGETTMLNGTHEQRIHKTIILPGATGDFTQSTHLNHTFKDGAYGAKGAASTLFNGVFAGGGVAAGVTGGYQLFYWAGSWAEGTSGRNRIAPGTSLHRRLELPSRGLSPHTVEMNYTLKHAEGANSILALPYRDGKALMVVEANNVQKVEFNPGSGAYIIYTKQTGDNMLPQFLFEAGAAGLGRVLCDVTSDNDSHRNNGSRYGGGLSGENPGGGHPPGQDIRNVTPGAGGGLNPAGGVGGR